MLAKVLLLLIFCGVSTQYPRDNSIYLTKDQVGNTFDGVMSDDYIKVLAKQFAEEAATHFLREIENKKKSLMENFDNEGKPSEIENERDKTIESPKIQLSKMKTGSTPEKKVKPKKKLELDPSKAMKLLQEPSPDGDNLFSSGELTDVAKNKIPVIQVTKINGIYYRRLLGMI